jgi:hypothetical protein
MLRKGTVKNQTTETNICDMRARNSDKNKIAEK